MPTAIFSPKNPICLPCRLFMYVHSFSRNFRLEFRLEGANLQCREGGGCRGRDGTAQKSVGEFLQVLHSNFSFTRSLPLCMLTYSGAIELYLSTDQVPVPSRPTARLQNTQ